MASPTDTVRIFDTTLRDGEQSPGIGLSAPTRSSRSRRQLERARRGRDRGRVRHRARRRASRPSAPIAQPVECDHRLARAHQRARTSRRGQRVAAGRAQSAHPHLHRHLATSTCEHKLRDDAREMIVARRPRRCARAKWFGVDVEFSCEDATRTEPDFLAEVVRVAIDAGATTINLPGHGRLLHARRVRGDVPRRSCARRARARQGVSCRRTATTTWAWPSPTRSRRSRPARRQVECTINGIGERAGNASLEEIVMLLQTRARPLRAARPASSTERDHAHERAWSRGSRGYARAAEQGDRRPQRLRARGRHPPARRAQAPPHLRDHGRRDRSACTAPTSCSASTRAATRCGGRSPTSASRSERRRSASAPSRASRRWPTASRQISSLDLEAIASDSLREREEPYKLVRLAIATATARPPGAEITIENDEGLRSAEGSGDGPVDAAFSASNTPLDRPVEAHRVRASAPSPKARRTGRGPASSSRSAAGTFAGQAVATDIAEASARAYLRACAHARIAIEPDRTRS